MISQYDRKTFHGVVRPADATEMIVYADGELQNSEWINISTMASPTVALSLQGNGDEFQGFKSYNVKFKDANGLESFEYRRTLISLYLKKSRSELITSTRGR